MPRVLRMFAGTSLLSGALCCVSACGRLQYEPFEVGAARDAPTADGDVPRLDVGDAHAPTVDFLGPLPACPDIVASFPSSNVPFNLVGASRDSFFVMFRPDVARTYAGLSVPPEGALAELTFAGGAVGAYAVGPVGFVYAVKDEDDVLSVLGADGFGTLRDGALAFDVRSSTDAGPVGFDVQRGARLFYGGINTRGRFGMTTFGDRGTGIDGTYVLFNATADGPAYVRRAEFEGTQLVESAALLNDGRAVVAFAPVASGFAVDALPVSGGDVVVTTTAGVASYVVPAGARGAVHAHPVESVFYTEHSDGIDAYIAEAATATPLWSSRWQPANAQLVAFHVEIDRVLAVVAFERTLTWDTLTATASGAGFAVFTLDSRGIPTSVRSIGIDGGITRLDLTIFGRAAFATDGDHVVIGFDLSTPGGVTICGQRVENARNYGWMVVEV